MPNTLYVEAASGLSGDMFLGALAALADDYDSLLSLPQRLGLLDARVEISQVNKNGIVCKRVSVIDLSNEAPSQSSPSHDHEHHEHEHQGHGPAHHHHHHQQHPHHHRHLSDILAIIEIGEISSRAKEIAKAIFTLIGEAESRIHDIPLEKIHFHEVSGVDSIIDIVGCAELIATLDISKTYADPVCVGYGSVKTQHGLLPVPAPATAEILKGIPTFKGQEPGERSTPTGAAVLKYLRPDFHVPSRAVRKIAYGPGQKDFAAANVLRLSLLEDAPGDAICVICCNIDDMTPEELGSNFQEGLLAAGALDFTLSPVFMKKGRPGQELTALAPMETADAVIDFVLENTTTIGVRYWSAKRKVLQRSFFEMDTEFGAVRVKETVKPSGRKRRKIERESLDRLSRLHGLPAIEISKRIDRLTQEYL